MASDLPENEQPETDADGAAEVPAAADETPATAETPAAEAPAEEAPATEPAAAETPVAEAADDAPAEDAPAEDSAAADAPAAEVDADAGAAAGLTLGSGAPAEPEVDPNFRPVIRGKVDRFGAALGTGRRKTSVARVRIMDGDGQMTVNGRTVEEYLPMERDRALIMAPLKATEQEGKVNVWVRVEGGGTTGQTGAIVLGIARALQARDETLHHTLADGGWLTRDGRMVERKKYGLKKARKSFQFSKR